MRAFMQRTLCIAISSIFTVACAGDEVSATMHSSDGVTIQSQSSAGVAVMVGGEGLTTVAFTQRQDKDALLSLLDGSTHKEFDWVTITFPSEFGAEMSRSSLKVDFGDKAKSLTYRQGYRGPCNPAKEDLAACWLVEHVTSGEPGASGSLELKLVDGAITGGWDITIERVTDKFGEPLQWHRYSTSSVVNNSLQAGSK